MAKLSYVPTSWCLSATCLLFKPNKPDPCNPACYRPIALMNCVLKLWTAVLTNVMTNQSEAHGTINDSQDGFRPWRQTYDSLATHIHCLEDAKENKNDIYTGFADYKSAFNAMDHRLLFQIMRDLGIHPSYIDICKRLYLSSSTYFMTPHGNTEPIQIERGTLQGDTLSPFLFTLFLEPLMRWLKTGSRGYKPTSSSTVPGTHHITYDEHGYADDISITTGTFHNMIIQLKKLVLFSQYTHLHLEIPKCEITGALWSRGNPVAKDNLHILRSRLNAIKLTDDPNGPRLKFLPPNKSYKMLGVHINPLLDFKEHHRYITKDVRKIAAQLKRRTLSPARKQLVVEQLLKSKFHAVHLGILPDLLMKQIDQLLNAATRAAHRLTPSHPTECIYAPLEGFGLNRQSITDKSLQQGTKHLCKMLNRPGDRGTIAYQHVLALSRKYLRWPAESFDHRATNYPTLRLLSRAYSIPTLEFTGIPRLHLTNPIADTLRKASRRIDTIRAESTQAITAISDSLDYNQKYKSCTPLHSSSKLIRHLTPLWETGAWEWSYLLVRMQDKLYLKPTRLLADSLLNASDLKGASIQPLQKRLERALKVPSRLLSHNSLT